MCYLKLEIDNVTLTWRKPPWSSLKNSVASPDFILRGEVAYTGSQILCSRYMTSEEICDNLEEGFLDISVIKEVTLGDEVVDLGSVCKRHGVEDLCHENNCVTVLYGSYLSENRKLWFIAPGNTASIWYHGLRRLVEGVHRLRLQTDKRLQWLKIQYLQLYYENERCTGPTPADAIKVGLLLLLLLFVFCLYDFVALLLVRSSQCSTTGVTKALVCTVLSVGWCI